MDSDFGRIARFYPSFANSLAYNADGNLNVNIGLNTDDFFIVGRPIAQVEILLSFIISQLDYDLSRSNITDRRTQERLGEILKNIGQI